MTILLTENVHRIGSILGENVHRIGSILGERSFFCSVISQRVWYTPR